MQFLAVLKRLLMSSVVTKTIPSNSTRTNRSPVRILHRCDNFLIVDKPYDLLINSDDPDEYTLATLLSEQLPELVDESVSHKFRFVHRLDYATSGCLLLALNSDAARSAFFSFNPDQVSRKVVRPLPFVRKYYLGLVKGHLEKPKLNRGIIKWDALVGEDVRNSRAIERRQMMAVSKKELYDSEIGKWCVNPKSALTKVLVLEHGRYSLGKSNLDGIRSEYPASKILIRTLTGRRHQIRTHCLHAGHPIIGDYTYAGDGPPRMYLHAWNLKVSLGGEELENGQRLLDVVADDPFTIDGTEGRWISDQTLTSFNDDALAELE